jgi:hypothetical protein
MELQILSTDETIPQCAINKLRHLRRINTTPLVSSGIKPHTTVYMTNFICFVCIHLVRLHQLDSGACCSPAHGTRWRRGEIV